MAHSPKVDQYLILFSMSLTFHSLPQEMFVVVCARVLDRRASATTTSCGFLPCLLRKSSSTSIGILGHSRAGWESFVFQDLQVYFVIPGALQRFGLIRRKRLSQSRTFTSNATRIPTAEIRFIAVHNTITAYDGACSTLCYVHYFVLLHACHHIVFVSRLYVTYSKVESMHHDSDLEWISGPHHPPTRPKE